MLQLNQFRLSKLQKPVTSFSKNKKAFHDYEILDEYEAGIVLAGEEVKSIKQSQANLKGSHVEISDEEAFAVGIHISPYKLSSNPTPLNPTRRRKLIRHKKEILKIESAISEKGITIVPLELYSKKGLIKMRLGLCRGKKLYDKRETLRRRDLEMEAKRAIKRFN